MAPVHPGPARRPASNVDNLGAVHGRPAAGNSRHGRRTRTVRHDASVCPFHDSGRARSHLGLIDFGTKQGAYLEKSCTHGLELKFDGSPEGLSSFENGIIPKCQTMAWDVNICNITTQSGDTEDIIKKSSVLSINDIRTTVEPYITGSNRESRAAQNNKLAVDFLMNSITPSFHSQLNTEKEKYTFQVARDPAHPNDLTEVKAFALILMWKVLIDRVTENCASKRREVELAIRNASKTMVSSFNKSDVPGFLDWFQATVVKLNDLNGDTNDLLKHFTSALQLSSCDRYNSWTQDSFIAYESTGGWLPWGDKGAMVEVDYPRFHAKALDHFRYLKSEKLWTDQSQSDLIVAMQAEVEDLRGGLRTNIPTASSKPKKLPSKGNKPAFTSKKKTKNKKNNKDRRRQRIIEEWRKKAPAAGEPLKKIVDGHEEIWCKYHQLWQRHTSEECELGKQQRAASAAAHKVNPISHAAHSCAEATATLHAFADLSRSD